VLLKIHPMIYMGFEEETERNTALNYEIEYLGNKKNTKNHIIEASYYPSK
jgi:hypothetical protein